MRPDLALALLLFAGAAPADEAAPPREKRICRAAAGTTGSHMRAPPVCRTAAEWQEIEEAQRRAPPLRTKAPQPEPWERTRSQ